MLRSQQFSSEDFMEWLLLMSLSMRLMRGKSLLIRQDICICFPLKYCSRTSLPAHISDTSTSVYGGFDGGGGGNKSDCCSVVMKNISGCVGFVEDTTSCYPTDKTWGSQEYSAVPLTKNSISYFLLLTTRILARALSVSSLTRCS